MTQLELQQKIVELFSMYWEAIISWGSLHSTVKPTSPFVQLKLISNHRQLVPNAVRGANTDVEQYYTEARLNVRLFTDGKLYEENGYSGHFDSSVNDLEDFINFLQSDTAIEWMSTNQISIYPQSDVQSTSMVVDTDYEFRAEFDCTVAYINEAHGMSGIYSADWEQTASKGGKQSLGNAEGIYIDEDKINITKEN